MIHNSTLIKLNSILEKSFSCLSDFPLMPQVNEESDLNQKARGNKLISQEINQFR